MRHITINFGARQLAQPSVWIFMFGRGQEKILKLMDAWFLLASFWKSMAQMADSVNINTEEIKKFSQTHVDDDDQPLFGDVDIWFQETLKPIRVPFIFCFVRVNMRQQRRASKSTRKSSEWVNQKAF